MAREAGSERLAKQAKPTHPTQVKPCRQQARLPFLFSSLPPSGKASGRDAMDPRDRLSARSHASPRHQDATRGRRLGWEGPSCVYQMRESRGFYA